MEYMNHIIKQEQEVRPRDNGEEINTPSPEEANRHGRLKVEEIYIEVKPTFEEDNQQVILAQESLKNDHDNSVIEIEEMDVETACFKYQNEKSVNSLVSKSVKAVRKIKEKKKSFFLYSDENMQKAIEAVKEGMSKKKASELFSVPRSTLGRKVSLNAPLQRKIGLKPPTELSEAEEKIFADWALELTKKAFPVHKINIIQSVKQYLVENGKNIRYFNDETLTPGQSWFDRFLKRHPNLIERQAISNAHTAVTKDLIENWFDNIHEYIKKYNLEHVLSDPRRVFNADVVGFTLCPKTGVVLGPDISNEEINQRDHQEKRQITLMGTFSADGNVVPPMLIFPYTKMPNMMEYHPENWGFSRSFTGWINSEVFSEYISKHFLPYLNSRNIIRPVILFVDGYSAPITLQVSKLCDENGILLISFFPNTTNITQPAEASVFKPLKTTMKNFFPKDITRYTFGYMIKSLFDKFATAKLIQNGFRICGIFPFDKNNVDYFKYVPNTSILSKEIQSDVTYNFQVKVLEIIESKIDKNELELFLQTYINQTNWEGSIESVNLYKVWSSIKDDCSKFLTDAKAAEDD